MNLQQLRGVFSKAVKMPFPEHRELVRQIGADSMVLLKNNDLLPINRGKVALFGAGAVDTVCCGIFYNYVYTDHNINVKEGLENNGFTLTTTSWLAKMEKEAKRLDKINKSSREEKIFFGDSIQISEVPISVADMAEAILGTDTCIYVVRRHPSNEPGGASEYQLTEEEQENLKLISGSFKNIILVLNSGMLELASVARMKAVKGIILMGYPGMEAGNSLVDILAGAVNPSGRLGNTWAKKYKDYSTCYSSTRHKAVKEIDYKEGIYVGYRYFDAFDVTPLFPFGYGLSYTSFDIKLEYFEATWIGLSFRIKVTNTGDCAGREVVQIYCSHPNGKLEKPYQALCGFAKTGKLKPGDSEEITIKIPIISLCSFDDEVNSWVMEKGDYLFRVGNNSRDTVVSGKMNLDKLTTIKKVSNVMPSIKKLDFLIPPPRAKEEVGDVLVSSLSSADFNSENRIVRPKSEFKTYVTEGSNYSSYVNNNKYEIPYRAKEVIEYIKPCGSTTFVDVIKGNISIEAFVSSLSPEILARIVCGNINESKIENENRFNFDINLERSKFVVTAKTTSQFANTLGIPEVAIADGPSGLHIKNTYCTCFPSPMNMGQTWDMSAMVRMGRAFGREMEYFDVDYCLAPAVNINRNPMKSSGYEFYSEDPALAGILASGFVSGVKRYEGRNVVLKDLPTFNQENGIREMNINVSKRAFAELYLRSFSACQYTSAPAGILCSGNRINGDYVSSQRGILTEVIRDDWGFNGFVMTDWGSKSEKAYDLHAGCDLIMPGYDPDKILEAMMEIPPIFGDDGYVTTVEEAFFCGTPMIRFENWGSFLPDKKGKDLVVTRVAADVELNPNVLEKQKEGCCKIETQIDGSRTITYRGINRGSYFALGELQQAVIHLLSELKNSAAMKKLLKQANI